MICWLDYEFLLVFHYSCKSKTYFTVCSKVNLLYENKFCILQIITFTEISYKVWFSTWCHVFVFEQHFWFCTKLCVVLTVWSAEMQTFLRKLTIVRLSWFYDFLTCLSVQLNTVKQLTARAGIFVQIWIRKNDNVDILMSHLLLCCLSCKYLLLQYFIFCLVVYFVVTSI